MNEVRVIAKEEIFVRAVLGVFLFFLLTAADVVAQSPDDPTHYSLDDLTTGVDILLAVGENGHWETEMGNFSVKVLDSDGAHARFIVTALDDIVTSTLTPGESVVRDVTRDGVPDYELKFVAVQASEIEIRFQLLSGDASSDENSGVEGAGEGADSFSSSGISGGSSLNRSGRIGAPIRGILVSDAAPYIEVPRSLFSFSTLNHYRFEIIAFLFAALGILVLIATVSWIHKNRIESANERSFFLPKPEF